MFSEFWNHCHSVSKAAKNETQPWGRPLTSVTVLHRGALQHKSWHPRKNTWTRGATCSQCKNHRPFCLCSSSWMRTHLEPFKELNHSWKKHWDVRTDLSSFKAVTRPGQLEKLFGADASRQGATPSPSGWEKESVNHGISPRKPRVEPRGSCC